MLINAVTLPAGQVGNTYPSTSLSASSGTSPFAWSATGLPAGLSLSSAGVLTGAPTVHGSFSVAVTVKDSSATPLTRTMTLPLSISPAAALALSTPSLAPATVGTPYTQAITVTGGSAPVIAVSGLPAGLSFDALTGEITGTPTSASPTPVVVTITVTDPVVPTLTQTLNLTVNPAVLAIVVPATVPAATVGQPYTLQLSPAGGVAPYSWAATGLPAGLSIDGNGLISGTPTDTKLAQAKAALNVTVTVTDSLKLQASQTLSLTVNAAPATAVTPVPALNEWALAMLGLLAAGLGLKAQRGKLKA